MAHFAKLGVGNIVLEVHVVSNDVATTEQAGRDFLNNIYNTNDTWFQTSYNTFGGTHKKNGTPFRGNYAGTGSIWDEANNIFLHKKPYASWIKHIESASWKSPIGDAPALTAEQTADVTNKYHYNWNESGQSWDIEIIEVIPPEAGWVSPE